MRNRSPWRIPRVFLRHSRWYSHVTAEHSEQTGTPPDIIEDIYLMDVQRVRANTGESTNVYSYYTSGPDSTERNIIENNNTPLELIVKISASSPMEQNRNLAMKTMARRS